MLQPPQLSIGQLATIACCLEATIPKPGNVHRGADFADTGPSFLSLPVILLFMTGFGGIGAIGTLLDLGKYVTPIVALIGGVAIAGVGFLALVKLFDMIQSDSTVKMDTLVGRKGSVQVPIKKGSEGQVMLVTPSRGRFLIGAIADENIPNEAVVQVVEVVGDVVKVKRTGGKKKGSSGSKSSKKK